MVRTCPEEEPWTHQCKDATPSTGRGRFGRGATRGWVDVGNEDRKWVGFAEDQLRWRHGLDNGCARSDPPKGEEDAAAICGCGKHARVADTVCSAASCVQSTVSNGAFLLWMPATGGGAAGWDSNPCRGAQVARERMERKERPEIDVPSFLGMQVMSLLYVHLDVV